MRTINNEYLAKFGLLVVRNQADKGIWDGKQPNEYFWNCRFNIPKYDCTLIFTKEYGYHSSGWWKNPEFEYCLHLSISFQGDKPAALLRKVLKEIFGEKRLRYLLVEPPYSREGKKEDVWHYRLFCNPAWEPIIPTGEVYSTANTEHGWRSFSEIHGK